MSTMTPERQVKRRRSRFPAHQAPATPLDTTAVLRLRAAYTAGRIDFTDLVDRLNALDGSPGGDATAAVIADLPALAENTWSVKSRPKLRALDRGVLGILARITDPLERCLHAGAAADRFESEMDAARLARTEALVALNVRFDWPEAKCYTPYGIVRKTFHDSVAGHPGPPARYDSAEQALAVADAEHVKYETARAAAETARMVRDAMIRALTGGHYYDGRRVENSELAAKLGTSTARIAQIRKEGGLLIAA